MRMDEGYANDLDRLQRTPLQWACARGYDKVAQILIDFGADITIKDSFGRTAKDHATQKDHTDIVKVKFISY